MSLKPQPIQLVPKQTADVARAAFPKGNPYLIFRDEMGVIFQDDDFLDLYAQDGQPGFSPWRLAWVTIMQFRETLSDRQAAEAVRARLDWKYLLGLELTDPGFDFSVLSEFRGRLLAGSGDGNDGRDVVAGHPQFRRIGHAAESYGAPLAESGCHRQG